MASFTMALYQVIDYKPDNVPEDTWLGLSEYPIIEGFDRDALNQKIKDHYMFQEIGHETVEQFTFSMKRKMNEIMPLYNQLYETARIQFDPLSTVDIRTVSTASQEQTSEGKTDSSTEGDVDSLAKNVASTFPQVMLSGNKDYATSGADSNSQTKTTGKNVEESTAGSESTQSSDSRTSGYQGHTAQLIMQYRATILNIDMLIIADLDELFMQVWDNSDEFTQTKGMF